MSCGPSRSARAGSEGPAVAVLATARLVAVLDHSIVNVALPGIGRALPCSGGWAGGSSAPTH
jgi:hypothetical protein